MPLDSYSTLGRSGLRVSPRTLGTMTFGEDWGLNEASTPSLNFPAESNRDLAPMLQYGEQPLTRERMSLCHRSQSTGTATNSACKSFAAIKRRGT
jgi:hypothetical protein